jgi:F-type H+-transporting ATPase subunit a
MAHNPLDHVMDQEGTWWIFESLGIGIPLPTIDLGFYKFQVTKFMLLELIAAGLILAIFIPLARRAAREKTPKGPWWNAFEGLLTFVRDEIARPSLGEKDADRYVPFLWTLFLFILICNLLGMIPLMGSPTASIWMTGGLAVCAFVMLHVPAMIQRGGPIRYLLSLWPHLEIVPNPWRRPGEHGHGHDGHDEHGHADHHAPAGHARPEEPAPKPTVMQIVLWLAASAFGFLISLMIFVIELLGTVIKSGVLAIRLFANMFAGHTVLAVILLFIVVAGEGGFTAMWPVVSVLSVLGTVALSLLELFVAFLQAYVFVFLTALFMGMALHPAH